MNYIILYAAISLAGIFVSRQVKKSVMIGHKRHKRVPAYTIFFWREFYQAKDLKVPDEHDLVYPVIKWLYRAMILAGMFIIGPLLFAPVALDIIAVFYPFPRRKQVFDADRAWPPLASGAIPGENDEGHRHHA